MSEPLRESRCSAGPPNHHDDKVESDLEEGALDVEERGQHVVVDVHDQLQVPRLLPVPVLRSSVQGSGCRVQGSGCRVQGLGFRVLGSGHGV